MRKLHPATILVVLFPRLREVFQAMAPILIGSWATGKGDNFELIFAGVGMFGGVFAMTTYWTTRFDIETEHVVWHTGWLFRRDRRVPLEHVHNVNLHQNVLERALKVATVEVETAAGTEPELKLRVMALADAEQFREELLVAARRERHEVETGNEAEEPEVVVRLTNREILLGATTENHWLNIFIAAVPGGTLVSALLHKGAFSSAVSSLPAWGLALITLSAVTVLFVAGWIWGAIGYILKYGGFTVSRDSAFYRISHGLMAKVQIAIRPSRVEFISMNTTMPQRWIGRTTLFAGTAGSFGEAGLLAPLGLMLTKEQAGKTVGTILPGVEVDAFDWQPFAPIYYRALTIRCAIWMGILVVVGWAAWNLLGGLMGHIFGVSLWLTATMPVIAVVTAFLSRSESGFAISDVVLAVRRGYFQQRLSLIPIARIENLSMSQPPWWRRMNVHALTAQGMKHQLPIEAVPQSAISALRSVWEGKIRQRVEARALALVPQETLEEPASDTMIV